MVLLVIANHETEAGGAFPSVDTLARECNLQPRQIQYHIRTLEEIGELFTVPKGGPHGTNLYRTLPAVSALHESASRNFPRDIAPELNELGVKGSEVPDTSSVVNLSAAKQRFSEFWDMYGLKLDKQGAKAEWDKAVRIADPDEIIEGARRYLAWLASSDDPPDQQYAVRWLRKKRWEDEYPEAKQARILARLKEAEGASG